jgi:hypothetical protein
MHPLRMNQLRLRNHGFELKTSGKVLITEESIGHTFKLIKIEKTKIYLYVTGQCLGYIIGATSHTGQEL